jgi:signal transduction histidine kinase
MRTQHDSILILSRDAAFAAACRSALESEAGGLKVEFAAGFEHARLLAEQTNPWLVVLDEPALAPVVPEEAEEQPSLDLAVTLFADMTPVVVLGAPEHQGEIAALVAAGAAEFVARSGDFLHSTLALIERRLQQREREASGATFPPARELAEILEADFGELLRHELNNPLTGILGNAELLLAEVRRRRDGRLPQGAQQRLETITDLAVRLRETVRRLSQQLDERQARTAV